MPPQKSPWIGRALVAVLIVAAVYAVTRNPQWRDFEWSAFVASSRQVRPGWLLAAVCCVFSTHALRVVRWMRLMRPIQKNVRFADIFSATVIGFGAVALLGRAGEFIRPYLIARRTGVPVAGQISIWFLERFLDTLMILGLAGAAIGSMQWGADAELAAWVRGAGNMILAAAATAFAGLFAIPPFFGRFRKPALRLAGPLPPRLQNRLGEALARFDEGLQGLRDLPSIASVFGSSAVLWLVLWLAFHCILLACLPDRSFDAQQTIVFMGLLMVGSLLQVPGIGGGVQVATVAALTRVFGVAEEPASVTAIVVWLTTFMLAVPAAFLLLARQGLSFKSLRQLKSER